MRLFATLIAVLGVAAVSLSQTAQTQVVGDYFAVVTGPPGRSEATVAPPNAVRPAGTPKWEAVSIRPCPPPAATGTGERGGGGGPVSGPYRFSSDRMTLNCLSVRSLIRSAYHVYLEPGLPGDSSPLDNVLISGLPLVRNGRRDPTDGTDGGPDWLDTDGYTIEAKAEGVTDRALMQGPMLQAILEDRFKIKVHRETREMAVDALVVARGGSKLKPFMEGSCVRRPAGSDSIVWLLHIKTDPRGKLSGTMESRGQIVPLSDVRVEGQSFSFGAPGGFTWNGSIENNGERLNGGLTGRGAMPLVFTRTTGQTPASQQRDCRIERGGLNQNSVNIVRHAEGFTIDEFVKAFLSRYRGRFVIDKTGLAGKFDIHLEEEIGAEVRQRADPRGDLWGPSTAPALPDALERQLGLKLESTKGPVELLVIDHIERPSPN